MHRGKSEPVEARIAEVRDARAGFADRRGNVGQTHEKQAQELNETMMIFTMLAGTVMSR